VASFIGSPSMNFVRGTIERSDGGARFAAPGLTFTIPAAAAAKTGPVVLGVRPHDLGIDRSVNGGPSAVVSLVEPLGSEQIVYVTVPGGQDLVAAIASEIAPRIDEAVSLRVAPAAVHLFDADTGARVDV